MVFKSLTLFARCRGPDEFWRKRKIFKLASHFYGRRRNCYSITIKGVHKSLLFCTRGRRLRREQISELWDTRLEAACLQHGITPKSLKEGLARNDMFLNRKVLVDLAIWEPRTFKSLAKIAWARCKIDGLNEIQHLSLPHGVITRGMLK